MANQKVTVDLISSMEFNVVNKGYDQKQVDAFLDDICDEMERMEAEITELRQKTAVVRPVESRESGVSPEDESSFREILEMAKTVKDDTIRKAKEDAEAIRAKAETEARERLDGLAEEQESLQRQVTGLKKAAADYRQKFEALLQAQQEALEKAAELF